jgi:4-aminobutyrate aminotransferase-like enzyme
MSDLKTSLVRPFPEGQTPAIRTSIPGPQSRMWREREDKILAPGLLQYAISTGVTIERGFGATVTDVDGNTFLDLVGGMGVSGIGHSHPRFAAAIKEQVEKISIGTFSSEARTQLCERLIEHAPRPELNKVQFYSGGAEAIESALRLAKSFTGKHEFISFRGGFHGKTMGAMALMGSEARNEYGPTVPGNHIASYASCYRCPLGLKPSSCGLACAESVRNEIKKTRAGAIAALVVEPLQGTAGNIIPPKEFLRALADIARENDALLIVDEILTGFGRTGAYWGLDHSGAKADIVVFGKQLGGGMPITGLITRADIAAAKPWANPSGSSSSFGGNPLACAGALAALQIIDDENLIDNSRLMGEYFLGKLEAMADRYPFIGDVRGSGLFLAIEFVRDRVTKEPLPQAVTHELAMDFLRRGMLTLAYSSRFRILPPLTIDAKTIDNAVSIMTDAFDALLKSEAWRDGP